ncbi:response regulator [Thermodesulfobacteriota bacterium]
MIKILIVEDDENIREIFSRMVETLGHEAVGCSNGRQAWDRLCAAADIDLIITDVKMPEMDGRELVSLVRRHHAFGQLPVLIISGVAGEDELGDLTDGGLTFFLPKHVTIREMESYIGERLGV